jgi:hypothetical protein
MPKLTVDDGETVMHVGELAIEGKPDLDLCNTSAAWRALIDGRNAFIEQFLYCSLLRPILMSICEKPDVVGNQPIGKPEEDLFVPTLSGFVPGLKEEVVEDKDTVLCHPSRFDESDEGFGWTGSPSGLNGGQLRKCAGI